VAGPLASRALGRLARRYGPVVAREAWRRWQSLTPEQRERYRAQARGMSDRGREIAGRYAERARGRRPPPPGGAGY
jgi:hypothetical protein